MAASAIGTGLALRISAPTAPADGCGFITAALIKLSWPIQAIRADPVVTSAVGDRRGRFL